MPTHIRLDPDYRTKTYTHFSGNRLAGFNNHKKYFKNGKITKGYADDVALIHFFETNGDPEGWVDINLVYTIVKPVNLPLILREGWLQAK